MRIKTGDTEPPLSATLRDSGSAIDLTGAALVRVIMRSGATIITGDCDIVNPTGGVVEYSWATGDTDIAGEYETEFEITWAPGRIETVPNDKANNPAVYITEDLD